MVRILPQKTRVESVGDKRVRRMGEGLLQRNVLRWFRTDTQEPQFKSQSRGKPLRVIKPLRKQQTSERNVANTEFNNNQVSAKVRDISHQEAGPLRRASIYSLKT